MDVKNIDISALFLYENNPRKNEKAIDAVAESIKNFGFRVPITIDKNNVVVTGHTRIKAAKKLGMNTVPVIVIDDLTPDQIKAFRVVDNKVSEIAEWDFETLAIELESIEMDLTEFDFEIPEALIEFTEDNFQIELPKVSKSEPGDIYVLGSHRLMCGDATNQEDMKKLMDGDVADLYIVDPPYNVDYEGVAGKIMNDKQENSQFQEFLVSVFGTADKHIKSGGAFYIWHSESEGLNFRIACNRVGWKTRQCLIWNKNSIVIGRQDYQWKHEPCLYGWKEGAPHYFINDRTLSTVIDENKPNKSALHPTMKPVSLIGRLIANSSKRGHIILDNTAGSGTVMVAAEEMKRRAYMMEIDPRYVDVIVERYEKLTGQKAERRR